MNVDDNALHMPDSVLNAAQSFYNSKNPHNKGLCVGADTLKRSTDIPIFDYSAHDKNICVDSNIGCMSGHAIDAEKNYYISRNPHKKETALRHAILKGAKSEESSEDTYVDKEERITVPAELFEDVMKYKENKK
ncbi:hypothetical protein IMSAG049_00049 [Clostridiales bacterium]|nr:hypothetical protein IMSAG049_00049 [Clostridiales bacterium]